MNNHRLILNGYKTKRAFETSGLTNPLGAAIVSEMSYVMCSRIWNGENLTVNKPTVLKLKALFGVEITRGLFVIEMEQRAG